jgi:hypothetical protein
MGEANEKGAFRLTGVFAVQGMTFFDCRICLQGFTCEMTRIAPPVLRAPRPS